MEWFELKHRPQSRCGPKGSNERNVKVKRVADSGASRAAGRTILTHTGAGRTILTETGGRSSRWYGPRSEKPRTQTPCSSFEERDGSEQNETRRESAVNQSWAKETGARLL